MIPLTALEVPGQDDAGPPAPPLDLTPWRGKVVLVDFWASWCGPCRESFPWMQEMATRYGGQGLVIATVNLDQDREAADGFLAGRKFDFQFFHDPEGEIARAWDIQSMPSSILFDRDGKEAHRHSGFRADESAAYERDIQDLLETGAVASVSGVADAGKPASKKKIGARPWERGLLARRCMQFGGYPLDVAFDSHIYFSREAASGGRGFAGGGCGCN